MALSPELKAILACPKCRGVLDFREEQGEILCRACSLRFAIDNGVPVLLVDEAKPLNGAGASR